MARCIGLLDGGELLCASMSDGPTWTEPELRAELDEQGFQCEGTLPEVTWFGDSPAMAAELGELVRTGRKTATASLMWSWEEEGEPLSVAGEREHDRSQTRSLIAVR